MKKNLIYPIISGILTVFLIWIASQVVIVKVNQAVMCEQIKIIQKDAAYTREWIDKIRGRLHPDDGKIKIVLNGEK